MLRKPFYALHKHVSIAHPAPSAISGETYRFSYTLGSSVPI